MVSARLRAAASICAVLVIVNCTSSFASESGHQVGTVAAQQAAKIARPEAVRSPRSRLVVKWESGRLSLDAEGAPLAEVLQAISEETGIELTGAEGLSGLVFLHVAGMDLFQALRTLLPRVDFAIVAGPTGSASRQGTRVIILKRSAGSGRMNPVNLAERSATAPGVFPREQHLKAIHVARTGEPPNSVEPAAQPSEQAPGADQQSGTAALEAPQDPDASFGDVSAQPLAEGGDAEATDASSEVFPSTDSSPEAATSEKLAAVAAAAAGGDVTALREYLQDAHAAVQAAAFDALAAQDKDAAVEELMAIIKDTSQLLRLQALQLLTQLPQIDEQTVMTVLRDAANDPALSAYASQALAQRDNADTADTPDDMP